jgi:hypothetical protein
MWVSLQLLPAMAQAQGRAVPVWAQAVPEPALVRRGPEVEADRRGEPAGPTACACDDSMMMLLQRPTRVLRGAAGEFQ